MKETVVVNMIGGPGCGKSTMAAGVFAYLKNKGVDCELVTEFAKGLVWEERKETFKDENYIFAKQAHCLFRLRGKVRVIITDRPLFLTAYFNSVSPNPRPFLNELCIADFNSYENLNYVLNRVKPFDTNGRNETEVVAKTIDDGLKDVMKKNGLKERMRVDGDYSSIEVIAEDIIKYISKEI